MVGTGAGRSVGDSLVGSSTAVVAVVADGAGRRGAGDGVRTDGAFVVGGVRAGGVAAGGGEPGAGGAGAFAVGVAVAGVASPDDAADTVARAAPGSGAVDAGDRGSDPPVLPPLVVVGAARVRSRSRPRSSSRREGGSSSSIHGSPIRSCRATWLDPDPSPPPGATRGPAIEGPSSSPAASGAGSGSEPSRGAASTRPPTARAQIAARPAATTQLGTVALVARLAGDPVTVAPIVRRRPRHVDRFPSARGDHATPAGRLLGFVGGTGRAAPGVPGAARA